MDLRETVLSPRGTEQHQVLLSSTRSDLVWARMTNGVDVRMLE